MQIEHIGLTRRSGYARQTGNGSTVLYYQIRHGCIYSIVSEGQHLCVTPAGPDSFEHIYSMGN